MTKLTPLIAELRQVHSLMERMDRAGAGYLNGIPDDQQASARNLLHYLALRSHDLRKLQPRLASRGLSSLGRTESHVRHSLEAVMKVLHVMDGTAPEGMIDAAALTKEGGEVLLAGHTDALLGPAPDGRTVRIMVTMPGEAGSDYPLVRDLVAAGMDCMRINCAHDDVATWERMIHHLERANGELNLRCRLSMDIAGPKLRTAALEPGPPVLKIKPRRDALGRVTTPAIVAFVGAAGRQRLDAGADAILTLDSDPPALAVGDTIVFDDARGRTRQLRVRAHANGVVLAELDRTAYVLSDTSIRFESATRSICRRVVNVPPREERLVLKKGDTLILTPEATPGRAAVRDEHDRVLMPASIGITLPEVFADVRAGEAVWFDDGKIGGVVREVNDGHLAVEITQALPDGSRLAAGKGVNLPDTRLRLSALTDKDREDLAFAAPRADLIGYSFVRSADDVALLLDHLATLEAGHPGIILKIETRQAFAQLPKLLLACMRRGRFGVMIARGDLAVECGFERMAEVQEEILWICEAAHTPVIWATQVLESLAKTGLPSRAEVTDAAMSERAECVMLNKGPFIREAVATLDNILRRMQTHQAKKQAMLRPLHLAHSVLAEWEVAPAEARDEQSGASA
jgi:pyruvate kinase